MMAAGVSRLSIRARVPVPRRPGGSMTANAATAATIARHPAPSPNNAPAIARFPDFPLRSDITSGELERGAAFGAAVQAEPADAADARVHHER